MLRKQFGPSDVGFTGGKAPFCVVCSSSVSDVHLRHLSTDVTGPGVQADP